MPPLKNHKHEIVVQNLVKGMNRREAYTNAYPTANKWQDKSIRSKVSALLARDDVSDRYDELMERRARKAVISRDERRILLSDMAIGKEKDKKLYKVREDEDGKAEAIIIEVPIPVDKRMNAIDMLNKMDSEYTQKVDLTGEVSILDDKIKAAEDYINGLIEDD